VLYNTTNGMTAFMYLPEYIQLNVLVDPTVQIPVVEAWVGY
jgi:hypothetical protein